MTKQIKIHLNWMGAINSFLFLRAMEHTFVFRHNKPGVKATFFFTESKNFYQVM